MSSYSGKLFSEPNSFTHHWPVQSVEAADINLYIFSIQPPFFSGLLISLSRGYFFCPKICFVICLILFFSIELGIRIFFVRKKDNPLLKLNGHSLISWRYSRFKNVYLRCKVGCGTRWKYPWIPCFIGVLLRTTWWRHNIGIVRTAHVWRTIMFGTKTKTSEASVMIVVFFCWFSFSFLQWSKWYNHVPILLKLFFLYL